MIRDLWSPGNVLPNDVRPSTETVAYTPFLDALRLQLAGRRPAPYSLPGHQGRAIFTDGTHAAELFATASTQYDVAATGNLHIAKLLLDDKVSRMYDGACKVLTSGGSGANRVALRSILCAPRVNAPGSNFDVIIARGVHTSVPAAIAAIPGARPAYMPLRRDAEGAIIPTPVADVARALGRFPQAAGVVITSPTIAGRCADIPAIAALIAAHNTQNGTEIRLHVDQAWGSHFAFSAELPATALAAGADSFTTSLHKNIDGALTGLAVFGIAEQNTELLLRAQSISVAEDSTSCSSLLLASADAALALTPAECSARYGAIIQASNAMREYCDAIAGVDVLSGTPESFDQSRFTFRLADVEAKHTGAKLAEKGVRTLLSDGAYVSLHFTLAPREEEIERILGAIEHAARSCAPEESAPVFGLGSDGLPFPELPQILTPHEALHARRLQLVPLGEAVGRICADPVIAIPPGISLITYGQPFTAELLEAVELWRAAGAVLKGISYYGEVLVVR